MDITHLGHACIRIEHQKLSLTTDPWFYPAFLKSWFPYPDNREHLRTALASDYIYLSHAHEDHFDREFLKQVDPLLTSLIIPGFRSHYMEKELAKLGFSGQFAPIVLSHGESTTLPTGLKLTVLTDRSHKEDSALLAETPDGFRFLDSNDCELAIPDWPKDIDLLAAQFSGAFWYPQCYEFDAATMAQKCAEVRKNNLDRLVRRVTRTNAKAYMPSAGPAVFLDPALDAYNAHGGIFPHWEEVAPRFHECLPSVDIWPFCATFTDINDYRHARREEWASWYREPDDAVGVDELASHFYRLQRNNKRFVNGWEKDVLLSASHSSWQLRLGLLRDHLEETFDPAYYLRMPPRVLRAVIDGRATWETALLSMRVGLRREPDVFDSTLMGLLTYGDRPIQTATMAKQRSSDELVTRDGITFQRWCPHAGEDLTYARMEDGMIICPRHEWAWDDQTGRCLNHDIPLRIQKLVVSCGHGKRRDRVQRLSPCIRGIQGDS